MGSIEGPFGNSVGGVAGPSEFGMVGWGSLCSIRAPSVPHCFCMSWSFFTFFHDLLNILINQSSDILQHSQNRPTGDRW